jgi:MoaA/NifB/PqqE/SkfB family radical SAM enzyme
MVQQSPLGEIRRYFAKPEDELRARAEAEPVCLYLETTNRCNLPCTTCPRTYEVLEPETDMSWELFTSIVTQFESVRRVVLHGVGEPMLVKDLPDRIQFLKKRGIYVLFNTNGTLLSKANGEALLKTGLDELRVSLDAAEPAVFQIVRGRDMFDLIVRNVTEFCRRQRVSSRFALAHRDARDDRAARGVCSPSASDGRTGSLPATFGVLRSRAYWNGAS